MDQLAVYNLVRHFSCSLPVFYRLVIQQKLLKQTCKIRSLVSIKSLDNGDSSLFPHRPHQFIKKYLVSPAVPYHIAHGSQKFFGNDAGRCVD